MDTQIRRIFVEKKNGYDIEAKNLLKDLKTNLGLETLKNVRILNRYDVAGISNEEYNIARNTIFSEPNVDKVYDENIIINTEDKIFAVEYLPGQYDQRADSAAQCIAIVSGKEKPVVAFAKVIILEGNINLKEVKKIKSYYINPVDSREAELTKPNSLEMNLRVPHKVDIIKGFTAFNEEQLVNFINKQSLAMSYEDLKFCRDYFCKKEHRDPTITEIKVIDTYWSDHCRHTTFLTEIDAVEIEEGIYSGIIEKSYEEYIKSREVVYTDKKKPITLMDIAVIGMKELRIKGLLDDLEVSEEINACSIVVPVDIEGKIEEWLVMFKNETHNHPTEIEPFGGAATCLGGAIRDPLSGRAYVYQAMRVTGSADPRKSIEDTLPGKLPQKKITTGAAHGYSSYGNQIGLATGMVSEIYDEDYVAKRMEIGAVIAAAPKENVVRETSNPGDIIILLGGRTGRDGCGGATGSSKEHTEESILNCGAEVQKGNAPTERKIQRLFRNSKVSKMIKKCNDFGAGGVSVAIGELAEGLDINLDAVPKKYEGLDGTELAISESQERMAVVVEKEDVKEFIKLADEENLEAVEVAVVCEDKRLKMNWKGNVIVDLSREFLDTNGVTQHTKAVITSPKEENNYFNKNKYILNEDEKIRDRWITNLADLNICSQKGLVERFDSTIGAASVLMPFGGKYQLTPTEGMAAKIPVLNGNTTTGTIMTYGYNSEISKWSPFHGALYAVIESCAKVVAMGGKYNDIRLTFQEYFEKLGKDYTKWGKPMSALLGALFAQKKLSIAAIGGKDSMSGSFKEINVPPTLVSFAVAPVNVNKVISQEFKSKDNIVVIIKVPRDKNELPLFDVLINNFTKINKLIEKNLVLSSCTVKHGGVAAAISKMCFGNKLGFTFNQYITEQELFKADYGSIILELNKNINIDEALKDVVYKTVGYTTNKAKLVYKDTEIEIDEAIEAWSNTLENVFPTKATEKMDEIANCSEKMDVIYKRKLPIKTPVIKTVRPKVLIPVFPGTNCEYDSARAFEKAGAEAEIMVFRNLTPEAIENSIIAMEQKIRKSQIIMLPGGFSAGDEPDGSGKFIAAIFRNIRIKDAVSDLLKNRDGLMLGICNGFQALIKLGLVPYGEIKDIDDSCPTLTYNEIGRHVSCMVNTKITSNLSPWLSKVQVGDIHKIAVSHGEGRFVASEKIIKELIEKGQVATQYVNLQGEATYDIRFNPNGSYYAVEGITSPDGRVLGKMGHSERLGENVIKNVPGEKNQKLFEAGVEYFK